MITLTHRLLSSAWAGSVWFSGFVAAPVLFTILAPNKPLAGQIAGTLFQISGYIGLVCGLTLLALLIITWRNTRLFRMAFFYILTGMLVLVSINLFALQPEMIRLNSAISGNPTSNAADIRQIHAIASSIHLALSVLAGFLVCLRFPLKKANSEA